MYINRKFNPSVMELNSKLPEKLFRVMSSGIEDERLHSDQTDQPVLLVLLFPLVPLGLWVTHSNA